MEILGIAISAREIIFLILAAVIVLFAILTVTSKRILRAALYLFVVLMATSGLYFLMNYEFLAAVQLALYAGGIMVLIVFSILLTSHISHRFEPVPLIKQASGITAALAGIILCGLVIMQHQFIPSSIPAMEMDMKEVGTALLGQGKNGYILPFEVISILLLASMVGAIVIARKSKKEGE